MKTSTSVILNFVNNLIKWVEMEGHCIGRCIYYPTPYQKACIIFE